MLLLPCILHYPTNHGDITKLRDGFIFVFEHLELPRPSVSKCLTQGETNFSQFLHTANLKK